MYINIIAFLIAFMIGIIYIYITIPEPIILIKYPTPYSLDIVYKDDHDTCYKYLINEIDCPYDKSKIIKYNTLL